VNVIVSKQVLSPAMLSRAVGHIEWRFKEHLPLVWACPQEGLELLGRLLPGRAVTAYLSGKCEDEADILVYVDLETMAPDRPAWRENQRVYFYRALSYNGGGRFSLMPVQPEQYDAFDNPHIDKHLFSRLSSRKWGFINFPYGCLYMDPDSGPIDPFGFRISFDWRTLRNRNADHKLVAVYGGSAAFSCCCSHEEMFSSRLEEKLNRRASERNSPVRFTVLNFGMHDNVVMQEMLTYLLHAYALKPDIVIAHDGHNDLWYGLTDDPFLVNNYDIIYQRHSEMWSKLIHGTGHVPSPSLQSCAVGRQEFNLPQKVIKAYVSRKRQFEELTRAHDTLFLWGLQPMILGKSRLSANEKIVMESVGDFRLRATPNHEFLAKLFSAFDMLASTLRSLDDIHLVDLYALIDRYDESYDVFSDSVHLNPQGDDLVADMYLEALAECGPEEWLIR
jgi:hypothetical protein